MKDLINPNEYQRQTGIDARIIRWLLDYAGIEPAMKVGRGYLYHANDIERVANVIRTLKEPKDA